MSDVIYFGVSLEVLHQQIEHALQISRSQSNDSKTEGVKAGVEFGADFGLLWDGIKCLFNALAFIHHACVSDERAWLVYVLVFGMMSVSYMIYKKEHKYQNNTKTAHKLSYVCDYLALTLFFVSIAYIVVLVYSGLANWSVHAITEIIILVVAFLITKSVVCLPQADETEYSNDLDVLPFPGFKPMELLPRVIYDDLEFD